MATALIIGASRGIGFELARQYRAEGCRVIGTVRNTADSAALTALDCEVLTLDVANADHCAALGAHLRGDVLATAILVAGVYGPDTTDLVAPEVDDFDQVMHANVLGAMHLLPVLGPLVAQGAGRLAVISSRMGSIGLRSNTSGWLYRASKAALNSVLADTALTFGPAGAICVTLHPGWVRTDMGGAGADLSVQESAAGIRATLAGLTTQQNGQFLNYDGARLVW